MHLKGNFEPSSLSTVLQMLSNDTKTGLLRLTNEDNDVRVFFKDGVVIYARSMAMESVLGRMLVGKGVLTQEELDLCLEEAVQIKQALGNILVKRGHVSLKRLKQYIAEQAEEVIYSVFFWDRGRFDYNDSELIPPGVLVTRLDIMNILLEASRRVDELAVLKKQIPGDEVVLKPLAAASPDSLKLSPVEWRFLSLVDGKRNVGAIMKESGYDKFSVYQMLHTLISMGLIEKDEDLASRNRAYGPVIELHRDFMKIIRRELERELGKRPYMIVGSPPPKNPAKMRDFVRHLRETEMWKWISAILVQAKPTDPDYKELFSGIHPDNPASKNQEWVFQSLASLDPQKGARFLARGVRMHLDNILAALPGLVGGFAALDIITELAGSLSRPQGPKNGLPQGHMEELQGVFARASQSIAEQLNNEEERVFGIFALRNRKFLG